MVAEKSPEPLARDIDYQYSSDYSCPTPPPSIAQPEICLMRLSRRCDYALRVLIDLTQKRGNGPISIRVLAKTNDVPKRFLEQIMIDLKEQGWVAATTGRDCGFQLVADPEQLTVGQIVRFFDGVLAPIGCVSVCAYEACTQEHRCTFRRLFLDIRNYTAHRLDSATLAQVAKSPPVTPAEIASMGFTDGDGI